MKIGDCVQLKYLSIPAFVRYIGDDVLGLEYTAPLGNCDGTHGDNKPFSCPAFHGRYVSRDDVVPAGGEGKTSTEGFVSFSEEQDVQLFAAHLRAVKDSFVAVHADLQEAVARPSEDAPSRQLVEDLQTELADARTRLEEVEAELAKDEEKVEEMEAELTEDRRLVHSLEEEIEKDKERMHDLEEKIEEAEAYSDESDVDYANEMDLDTLRAEIARLQGMLQAEREKSLGKVTEVSKVRGELAEARKAVAELVERVDRESAANQNNYDTFVVVKKHRDDLRARLIALGEEVSKGDFELPSGVVFTLIDTNMNVAGTYYVVVSLGKQKEQTEPTKGQKLVWNQRWDWPTAGESFIRLEVFAKGRLHSTLAAEASVDITDERFHLVSPTPLQIECKLKNNRVGFCHIKLQKSALF